MRALRVAHLDAEVSYSGGEVQVFLLLEGLRARGHEGVLYCPPGSAAESVARARSFPTQALELPSHMALTAVGPLARRLARARPDLVHTNSGRDAWLGGFAAWRSGLPAVTTRRMDRRIKRGVRTHLTYRTFADRVVAISPGVKDCLVRARVPAEHVAVIPEAFDPARVVATRPPGEVRADLGVGPQDRLVLALGALAPRKGLDVLVDAVALLPPGLRERAKVRIAGEGDERQALEARARARGLGDRMRLLGARADVGDLLAASDVVAMPSRAEGLGVAALEAMGAGRPVVASRVGGLAFSVVDGETGCLVPPDDAAALARALADLLVDDARREGYGQAARRRACLHFAPEAMVAAYEALYLDVLAARRA